MEHRPGFWRTALAKAASENDTPPQIFMASRPINPPRDGISVLISVDRIVIAAHGHERHRVVRALSTLSGAEVVRTRHPPHLVAYTPLFHYARELFAIPSA